MMQTAAAAIDPGADHRRWRLFCILAVLVNATLETMLVPALPSIRADLGLTPAQGAWAFSAFLLVAAVSMPIVGRLADIFGARRMIVAILGCTTIGVALPVIGHSFPALIAGQAIQGLGMAFVPLGVAVLREAGEDREGFSSAALLIAAAASTMIGALLAAPILKYAHYHALYWVALVPDLLLVAVGIRMIRRGSGTIPGPRPSVDWVGATLLATGLLALLLGISLAEGGGWGSAQVVGLLAGAVLLLLLWCRQSLASRSPLVDLGLLARPEIGCVAALQLLSGFGIFASFVLVPMLVEAAPAAGGLGLDAAAASYALAPFGAAGLIAPFLAGPLRRRIGAAPVLGLGILLAIMAPLLLLADPGIVQVGVATGLLGFGIGLMLTQSFDLIGAMVSVDRVASVGSLVYVLKMIGAALGGQVAVGVMGPAPNAPGFFDAFLLALTAMIAAAIAAIILIRAERRARPQ